MENNTENNTELETMTADQEVSDEQQQMDAAESAEGEELEAASEEESTESKTPAWVDFISALDAHAVALGLQVQDQAGFTKYINAETGHKLYVAKQGRAVKRVDTTLPILGQDGTYALSKPNGKIECHVVAELETVTKVLTQLADSSIGKLRAAKRAPKAAEIAEVAAETETATEEAAAE